MESFLGSVAAGADVGVVGCSSGGSKGTNDMLKCLTCGAECTSNGIADSCVTFASSWTGKSGTKEKFGLRLVGVEFCEEVGGWIAGDGRGVGVDPECDREVTGGSGNEGACSGYEEVLFSLASVDAVGNSGSRRIGTESRYGRISGSTFAESSRFFHLEGTRDGVAASREIGNGGAVDDAGGAEEPGMDVVENGMRQKLLYFARGRDCMICFSSSKSL